MGDVKFSMLKHDQSLFRNVDTTSKGVCMVEISFSVILNKPSKIGITHDMIVWLTSVNWNEENKGYKGYKGCYMFYHCGSRNLCGIRSNNWTIRICFWSVSVILSVSKCLRISLPLLSLGAAPCLCLCVLGSSDTSSMSTWFNWLNPPIYFSPHSASSST